MNERDSYSVDHRLERPVEFQGFPIISDQISREGLGVVWRELEKVLQQKIDGDVMEFGCYIGTTSLFIRRLLDMYEQSEKRGFHVYDSFEGLPEKLAQDESPAGVDFKAGKLYVGKKELLQQFRIANLRPPIAHKGWFNELTSEDVPRKIAFAFLDGDFYDSILSSLKLIWPKMAEGGRIVIDDYHREALPGVDRAIQDFFQNKSYKNIRAEHQKAIIEL